MDSKPFENKQKNMANFSENKKIALSAIAIFTLSFAIVLFFLGRSDMGAAGGASVLHSAEGGHQAVETRVAPVVKDKNAFLDTFEPAFVTDEKGVITEANNVFCSLMAAKCPELVGHTFFDYVNKEDLGGFAGDFAKISLSTNMVEGIGPYRLVNGTGEKLVLLSAQAVKDVAGKLKEIWFTSKDISDQVGEFKKNKGKSWMEKIFPTINELKQGDQKLLVDKISYKK